MKKHSAPEELLALQLAHVQEVADLIDVVHFPVVVLDEAAQLVHPHIPLVRLQIPAFPLPGDLRLQKGLILVDEGEDVLVGEHGPVQFREALQHPIPEEAVFQQVLDQRRHLVAGVADLVHDDGEVASGVPEAPIQIVEAELPLVAVFGGGSHGRRRTGSFPPRSGRGGR